MIFSESVRKNFSVKQRRKLKRFLTNLKTIGYGNNLDKLATIYGSDKWGSHFYTSHYAMHFRPYKNKKINLLEIGAGGYKSGNKGGESLYMWKRYLPDARIFSIDILINLFWKKAESVFFGEAR